MTVFSDFHVHSSFSADSDASMESIVNAAVEKGLTALCFTEHLDMDYPKHLDPFPLDIPSYYDTFSEMKEKYHNKIALFFGIELGMQPHLGPACAGITDSWPFDYVIASLHLLYHDDPWYSSFWTGRDEKETYRDYFQSLYENIVLMKDFDTCAHLDYIVRYGPSRHLNYSYREYADVLDPILDFLIRHNKCLEINTSPLRAGMPMFNPAADVLARYYELGGRLITFGSDAHDPQAVAFGFSEAARMAASAGFKEYAVFSQRNIRLIPLEW